MSLLRWLDAGATATDHVEEVSSIAIGNLATTEQIQVAITIEIAARMERLAGGLRKRSGMPASGA